MSKVLKTTIMTSRDFNQNIASAKRAAKNGPVIITDRGKEAFVLQTIEHHNQNRKAGISLYDALVPKNAEEMDFEFEIPTWNFVAKVPDFE